MAANSGLFYGYPIMATDIDVQYFSHLNGLTLGNNWGDLIRLLDTCLVNGLPLTSITSASIDPQGDITLNLYAAHNCMLFQIIELTGFTPADLNGKYRIKGVPSANQLILKATHAGKSINTTGSAKLASLGYEIVFRDVNDVKRVYRAKNPTTQHPFIRVDESLTNLSGVTGAYDVNYARYAMVGLLEHMEHIDDYENPEVLQLPFDPANPTKNWKIVGNGTTVVRGWSRWYFATDNVPYFNSSGTSAGSSGARLFTLTGGADCFYLNRGLTPSNGVKYISGAGLFNESIDSSVIPNWFLMTYMSLSGANGGMSPSGVSGGEPLAYDSDKSAFFTPKYDLYTKLTNHTFGYPIMPDFRTGNTGLYNTPALAPLEIPFYDSNKYLRGSLKHILYCGDIQNESKQQTTPIIRGNSMFIYDSIDLTGFAGGVYFYLGGLE